MKKVFLPVGLVAAACLSPWVAIAQDAAQPAASPASDRSGELEAIVVTAQRRSERLIDVPISVTSLTARQIVASGIQGVSDLQVAVPGLSFNALGGGQATPRLRGVGNSTAGPGIEPGVAVYVDGVYHASASGSLFNFNELDLDSISVLKGPQGTLFGRNATGGLVQITTRDPGRAFTLEANVGYGNYDTKMGALYVGGPLSDSIRANFAARGTFQGKGYGRNQATGRDVGRNNRDIDLRGKIIFEPSETTTATLSADYGNTYNSLYASRLFNGSTPAPFTGPPFSSSNQQDIDSDTDWRTKIHTGGVSLTVDQALGSTVKLKSITAYRRLTNDIDLDLDATRTPSQSVFPHQTDSQFSQELQLQSVGKNKFNWTVGGFYFDGKGRYHPSEVVFYNNPFIPFDTISINTQQTTKALAIYAQGDYELLPKTVLTLGVRENHEVRRVSGPIFFTRNGITLFTVTGDQRKTFNKATFRASLAYHFTPDALAYVSFNRGFKSGGFDAGGVTNPAFQPEVIDAYEIGGKAELLDHRVRVSGAGFYYNYKNIQVEEVLNGSLAVLNGGPTTIYGFDGDIAARIGSAFRVTLGATYLIRARFKDFTTAPNSAPNGGVPLTYDADVSGNRLPISPKLAASFGIDYTRPLAGDAGTITAGAAVAYQSSFFWQPDNNFGQGRYATINANLKWTSQNGRFSVRVWGRNLTDVDYQVNGSDNGDGSRAVAYGAPRTYGVTAGFKY